MPWWWSWQAVGWLVGSVSASWAAMAREDNSDANGPAWVIPAIIGIFITGLWWASVYTELAFIKMEAEDLEKQAQKARLEILEARKTSALPAYTPAEREAFGLNETDRWISETDNILKKAEWNRPTGENAVIYRHDFSDGPADDGALRHVFSKEESAARWGTASPVKVNCPKPVSREKIIACLNDDFAVTRRQVYNLGDAASPNEIRRMLRSYIDARD